MKRWVCPVCGYVHNGDEAPEKCPLCGVPGAKFKMEIAEEGKKTWACQHVIGDGQVEDAEVKENLEKEEFIRAQQTKLQKKTRTRAPRKVQ
jgi:rubredoxin